MTRSGIEIPNFLWGARQYFADACRRLSILAAASLILSTASLSAYADDPEIKTNQAWIENIQAGGSLKINSVEDAFEFVFSRLPDQVSVYPTENYYYFTFPADGVIYAGNLRLAAQDRDQGVIHFASFKQANQSTEAGDMLYKPLTNKDGVDVNKLGPFSYQVIYKEKSVVFNLNDVSAVEPPKDIVADGERYLGLVADESGVRFFLFYNQIHKVFAYVLDETNDVLDQFVPTVENSRVLVGQRTGFVFYDHHHLNRRVLIGVHGANTVVNNYYDGPADQLPENHIINDNLRKSIVDSDPEVKDKLDKFGYFKSGEGRYLISPYVQYLYLEELDGYHQCADNPELAAEIYDACFVAGDG
jgi:hypothetical protein